MESKDAKLDQLLIGISKLCAGREDCTACPFFIEECVFDDPKPKTWVSEEISVEVPAEEVVSEASPVEKVSVKSEPEVAQVVEQEPVPPQEDDSPATWLLSTSMGSVFTKYVFICSKCGFKKESVFSIPPITFCPECEKRKAGQ